MQRQSQNKMSSEAADVQQIEIKLLQLMEDFETGKLKAFGKDSRLHQMEEIREQQEKLAKLHFDIGADQNLHTPLSDEGLKISEDNRRTLMKKLAQLSESIENLQTSTHSDKKTSGADGKHSNFGTNFRLVESQNFSSTHSTSNFSNTDAHQHRPNHAHHHTKTSMQNRNKEQASGSPAVSDLGKAASTSTLVNGSENDSGTHLKVLNNNQELVGNVKVKHKPAS